MNKYNLEVLQVKDKLNQYIESIGGRKIFHKAWKNLMTCDDEYYG